MKDLIAVLGVAAFVALWVVLAAVNVRTWITCDGVTVRGAFMYECIESH